MYNAPARAAVRLEAPAGARYPSFRSFRSSTLATHTLSFIRYVSSIPNSAQNVKKICANRFTARQGYAIMAKKIPFRERKQKKNEQHQRHRPRAVGRAEKIDWVKRNCPLLRTLEGEFAVEKPFAGLRIALSVHLEAKTAYLCRVLAAGGAEIHHRLQPPPRRTTWPPRSCRAGWRCSPLTAAPRSRVRSQHPRVLAHDSTSSSTTAAIWWACCTRSCPKSCNTSSAAARRRRPASSA